MSKIGRFVHPYRVTSGKGFRLKDHDPRDTARLKEDKKKAAGAARPGSEDARGPAGQALRAGPLGRSPGLPGDGRRGEGRDDQARHVGREPAGLPGLLVQGAVRRGARPRLPLADEEVPARAGPHRHLQPLVLRGSARRPRAPRDPRQPEAPAAPCDEEDLEGALREHRRLRAAPRAQRDARPEVLPERLEEGAEDAASSSGSTSRTRTGSSPRPTRRNAGSGSSTWPLTRT